MPLQFSLKTLGKRFSEALRVPADKQRQAALEAMGELRDKTLPLLRANISAAGRFGSRWTDGTKAEITEPEPGVFDLKFTNDVPYFMVFQRGALIQGKPLLAIPLSFASDAQGVLARNFSGGLFRVDRAGKAPLLLSRVDKEPKYFLKESVRIPKKFRVLEIIKEQARNLGNLFLEAIRK